MMLGSPMGAVTSGSRVPERRSSAMRRMVMTAARNMTKSQKRTVPPKKYCMTAPCCTGRALRIERKSQKL
jgi:hypothetical protein